MFRIPLAEFEASELMSAAKWMIVYSKQQKLNGFQTSGTSELWMRNCDLTKNDHTFQRLGNLFT